MKKGLIFLLGIMSFLGVNSVSAQEIYLEYETNVNQIQSYINEIGYSAINEAISKTIKYYNENLSNDYPYYFISLRHFNLTTDTSIFYVTLTSFDKFSDYFADHIDQTGSSYIQLIDWSYNGFHRNASQISYNFDTNEIIHTSHDIPIITLNSSNNYFLPYNYYYSNFDYYFPGQYILDSGCNGAGCLTYLHSEDILNIPDFVNSNTYNVYHADTNFMIEPYFQYDDNDSLKVEAYTSINLNDYSYIALSLKDYNTIPESNSSTYTNIYVKGQLCITPVYNYGLTERKDILSGTQMQGCSKYYDDFTLTRMYILKTDVQNHAIYYLKAYDTSKDNYVKIDSSKFNITYISSENENNPEVLINGKLYPTLPYGSLTDTSTKSEDEGYNSGVSCAVGDFNCYNENNPGNMIDSIFSSPLEFLKDIWSSVTSIFDIITEFLSLLPDTMQSFLYLSFMIAVILGLLKLIL